MHVMFDNHCESTRMRVCLWWKETRQMKDIIWTHLCNSSAKHKQTQTHNMQNATLFIIEQICRPVKGKSWCYLNIEQSIKNAVCTIHWNSMQENITMRHGAFLKRKKQTEIHSSSLWSTAMVGVDIIWKQRNTMPGNVKSSE